jgi:hypothetical protein
VVYIKVRNAVITPQKMHKRSQGKAKEDPPWEKGDWSITSIYAEIEILR